MSPNGSSSHCSNALHLWQIALNKRINSVAGAPWDKKTQVPCALLGIFVPYLSRYALLSLIGF